MALDARLPAGGPTTPPIRSRATASWILYDLANTIFSFAILTFYFPRWVVNEMGGNDAMLGNTLALSMFLLFVTAPLLGAISDLSPRRIPFLVVTTLACVGTTALLGRGGLMVSLFFFGIANYFFQAGLIFYDSLLPEVSTPLTRGRVSGLGIGVGYIGSAFGLTAGSLLIRGGAPMSTVFMMVAFFFLLFALPCFLFVPERPRSGTRPLSPAVVREAMVTVSHTIARAREYPGLVRFLAARAFYTDVANTGVAFLAIYVTNELGFSEPEVVTLGAISIAASIVGGMTWGVVVDILTPKRALEIILVTWIFSLILGVLIPVLGLPRLLFYVVGMLAGVTLAGTWAADRTLMIQLSPPEYLGQFYGLYSMIGRFGQIVGPLLWGFVAITLGLGRPAAMFSLALLLVVAFAILRPLSPPVTSR